MFFQIMFALCFVGYLQGAQDQKQIVILKNDITLRKLFKLLKDPTRPDILVKNAPNTPHLIHAYRDYCFEQKNAHQVLTSIFHHYPTYPQFSHMSEAQLIEAFFTIKLKYLNEMIILLNALGKEVIEKKQIAYSMKQSRFKRYPSLVQALIKGETKITNASKKTIIIQPIREEKPAICSIQ